jgi:hypothetical protein
VIGPVRFAVDHKGARPANTLPAVRIKSDRFFLAALDEFFVNDIDLS